MSVYLIVNGHTLLFHQRAEQNLPPHGHAMICKEAFERRGYTVTGPLEVAGAEVLQPNKA